MSQPIPPTNIYNDVKRSLSHEIIDPIEVNNKNNQAKYSEKESKDQQDYMNGLEYSDYFIDEYNKLLDDIAGRESQNMEKYTDSQDFWEGSVEYLSFKCEQLFGYPSDFTDFLY